MKQKKFLLDNNKFKKNAFTLIELLAIIVILAIIAVITVPVILNIIENSVKKAAIDSAYGYKDAVQKYYVAKLVTDLTEELPTRVYDISSLPSNFDVNGEKPTEGWVSLKDGEVIDYSLRFGDYVVNYDEDTNSVIATKNGSLKAKPIAPFLVLVDDADEDGEISVGDEYAIGDEHFYIISTDEDETALITKYNLLVGEKFNQGSFEAISEDTEGYGWQSEDAKTVAAGPQFSCVGVIEFASTNYWHDDSYVSDYLKNGYVWGDGYPNSADVYYISYVYDENSSLYSYVEAYKTKLESIGANIQSARLMKYKEALDIGCLESTSNTCPTWISNTIFWLGSINQMQYVNYLDGTDSSISSSAHYTSIGYEGVRPVIVINTSDFDL